jgi:hypothetical protein
MSRRSSIPSCRLHRQSGQAVLTLADGLGNRSDVLLGPYNTAASPTEYARIIADWEPNGRKLPQAVAVQGDLSVNELILAFWPHSEKRYRRPDGTPARGGWSS